MRKSVHKPAPSIKRQINVAGSLDHHLSQLAVTPASKVHRAPNKRHHHTEVARSSSVSHFHKSNSQWKRHESEMFEPQLEPETSTLVPEFPPPFDYSINSTQLVTPRTSAEVLDKALSFADAHNNPSIKPKQKNAKKFAVTWMVAAFAVLTLAVVVMQNSTNIKLQLASNKAGFSSSLPSNLPSGYSLSQLNYTKGSITTLFKSNNNQTKFYSITQRPTQWDNKALQQNYIRKTGSDYVSQTAKGITVYLYGNHDASWLNNGIWYIANTNGTLSDNELLNIASGN